MYTSATMSFGDSALVSLMGLTTVFLCLIALALAVMIFSKIFSSIASRESRPTAPTPATGPVLDEETYAALLCVLSEETLLPLEKFRVTSIRALD